MLRSVGTLASLALFFGAIQLTFAADPPPPKIEDVAASASEIKNALNIMWMLLASFLIFFMQAGFALVETGFTRAKNVAHTMAMNMMVFCIGAVGYWLTGFGLMFGGVNFSWPEVATVGAIAGEWAHSPVTLGDWTGMLAKPLIAIGQFGLAGGSGFALSGIGLNTGILAFFIFQMVFMDTAATIPTGSMAERIKWSGFCLMALFVGMFIYPLVGGWVWGGGWLQNLGRIAGLGNGAVDFAGSGVSTATKIVRTGRNAFRRSWSTGDKAFCEAETPPLECHLAVPPPLPIFVNMTTRLEIDRTSLKICRFREFQRGRVGGNALFPGKKTVSGKSLCLFLVHPFRAREDKWRTR
jgi:hypothetical protein